MEACVCNKRLDITTLVHGDDFLSEGERGSLASLDSILEARMDVKRLPLLSPGCQNTIEYTDNVCKHALDPHYAQELVEMMNATSAKPAITPAAAQQTVDRHSLDPRDHEGTKRFRAALGMALSMGQDRSDIQFALKEIASGMSSPRIKDAIALKRLARYLVGAPSLTFPFLHQSMIETLRVYVDSDFAGQQATKKSAPSMCLRLGSHTLATVIVTQKVIALSSVEAEIYALGTGAAEGLYVRSPLLECGVESSWVVVSDSSAALAWSRAG